MTLKLAKPQVKNFRFNISQYHQMNEFGILSEDDRVELVEGEIIEI